MNKLALALALAFGLVSIAGAGVIDEVKQAQSQAWSAWGGEIGVRWNNDLLRSLDLQLDKPVSQTAQQDFRRHQWFGLGQGAALQFTVSNGALQGFSGGSLQARGGYVLHARNGSTIDLRNFTLRVRPGATNILDLVGGDGKVWFYTDRVMFELADNNHTLAVRAADIRITQDLADRLGAPESVGWEIGDMAMNTQVFIQGLDPQPERSCNPYPWPNVDVPGVSGAKYLGDLFMQTFSVDPLGCMNGQCDGPGGTDNVVGFAPTSSLINNKNDGTLVATVPGDPLGTSSSLYTANIAWYTMFTGSPPNYNPPYKNDQHPLLIWNMYRINADGSIEQIGRSGTKHAFLTINAGCLDSCNDPHSLGRGCGDTYGSGNNDSSQDMGPRSEIVPATATWGRCGSIWDPGCTGSEHSNGNGTWTQRLQTHESQIDPAANPGATYRFESWYIARDDISIYNSMATLSVTPHYSSSSHTWSLNSQTGYRLGPAIDRWVDPSNLPAHSLNTEVSTTEGHAKVAVKATDLGGGNWRYDYAVMNLDYARAVTQPAPNGGGPDPRVLSNKGFDSFSVPIPAGSIVSATTFRNGASDGSGAWTATAGSNSVIWSAGAQPTLDWGTMYTFSLTVNASPRPGAQARGNGNVTLHVATDGDPASFSPRSIVPTF